MGATLTTFDSVLKEVFLGPLRSALNHKTVLNHRLAKNEKDVEGDLANAKIPIHKSRNHGIGARAEDGDLPEAGSQGYTETKVPMRYLYGRIKVTGQIMKAAKSNKGSFVRAVQSESQGLQRDLGRDENRMLFRAGTGILATCGTTSNSTTVQLAAGTDMRWFEPGMIVDILVGSTGATISNGSEVTIVTVDKTNKRFTVAANVTTDSTHRVYRSGSRNAEIMGLDGIVNNIDPDDVDGSNLGTAGGLQGILASGNTFWQSTVKPMGGPLDFDYMQEVLDTVDNESGEEPTLIVCQSGVRAEYVKQLLPDVRYTGPAKKLDGGFSAVAYTGGSKEIPIVIDRDCYPATTMYFLNENLLSFYRLQDWDWMDEDGAILCRIPDKDGYEATLYCYKELGTSARNAHGRLDTITTRYTPGKDA
jgi:hypothetical protein